MKTIFEVTLDNKHAGLLALYVQCAAGRRLYTLKITDMTVMGEWQTLVTVEADIICQLYIDQIKDFFYELGYAIFESEVSCPKSPIYMVS